MPDAAAAPHAAQRGQGASVWNLWLSPIPLLVQTGIASRAWPFCGQKIPSASKPHDLQIN